LEQLLVAVLLLAAYGLLCCAGLVADVAALMHPQFTCHMACIDQRRVLHMFERFMSVLSPARPGKLARLSSCHMVSAGGKLKGKRWLHCAKLCTTTANLTV
jgi:hypothetical protein